MLVLLAIPTVLLVVAAHRLLNRHTPSNVLARHLRSTPDRQRSVVILIAMTVLLLFAAHFVEAAASGTGGWLNIVALTLVWDATKFGVLAALMSARAIGAAVDVPWRRVRSDRG